MIDLSVSLLGSRLRHPVLNASGTFDALVASRTMDRDYVREIPFSAYVPKTVTLEARRGNPPPRVTETPCGMINAIGLENPGLERFLEELPQLAALPVPVLISVGGARPTDYAAVVGGAEEALAAAPRLMPAILGYEINVSCPNVATGLSTGADARATAALVGELRPLTRRALVVKLTPNVTAVAPIAAAAEEAGADGISLINTIKALVLDPVTLRPFLGNTFGGLCGPAIKPIALRMVAEVAAAVSVPVIGMGGILGGLDVLEFVACGATAVAVGAATFADTGAAERIVNELAQEMSARGIRNLAEIRGCAFDDPRSRS